MFILCSTALYTGISVVRLSCSYVLNYFGVLHISAFGFYRSMLL